MAYASHKPRAYSFPDLALRNISTWAHYPPHTFLVNDDWWWWSLVVIINMVVQGSFKTGSSLTLLLCWSWTPSCQDTVNSASLECHRGQWVKYRWVGGLEIKWDQRGVTGKGYPNLDCIVNSESLEYHRRQWVKWPQLRGLVTAEGGEGWKDPREGLGGEGWGGIPTWALQSAGLLLFSSFTVSLCRWGGKHTH